VTHHLHGDDDGGDDGDVDVAFLQT
jgi:hypothetical protein